MAKFKVGDRVRLRPFEDLIAKGHADSRSAYGISRATYERYRNRGAYMIRDITLSSRSTGIVEYFIKPDCRNFIWPEYALEKA